MPSDVTTALTAARDAYRSTLVSSVEELRGMLNDVGSTDEGRAAALAVELGPFAEGRIDAGRLASLLSDTRTLTPASVEVLNRAAAVLSEAEADGDVPVEVEVPEGGDLRDAVRDALAGAGRVFGAARAAALAHGGAWRPEHEALFGGLPFRRWTSRERMLAPPLVVRVRGDDLRPAGLADFLDGALEIVLVVEGAAPPAALARLVSPGVMVVQATSPDGLAPLADFAGPVVAALFDGAATLSVDTDGVVPFVHDPRRGGLPWERLSLGADAGDLRAALEGRRWRARGWRDDLEHLLALATAPAGAPEAAPEAGADAPEPVTGADRLAAWLLARTDLEG